MVICLLTSTSTMLSLVETHWSWATKPPACEASRGSMGRNYFVGLRHG
jgi:hypothetical protein